MSKRTLSLKEAVTAAAILFELNTKKEAVFSIMRQSSLFTEQQKIEENFLFEWYAFVHAAVFHALMEAAPAVVVVEYLRNTQGMLDKLGYAAEDRERFIDTAFQEYCDAMVKKKLQQCPEIFFRRLLRKELKELPQRGIAFISATMAMVCAAVTDKLEQYDYALE